MSTYSTDRPSTSRSRLTHLLAAILGALLALVVAARADDPAPPLFRYQLPTLPGWIEPLQEAVAIRPSTLADFIAAAHAQAATEADALRLALIAATFEGWAAAGDVRTERRGRELLRLMETAAPGAFSEVQRSAFTQAAVDYARAVLAEEAARLGALAATPQAVPEDLGLPIASE